MPTGAGCGGFGFTRSSQLLHDHVAALEEHARMAGRNIFFRNHVRRRMLRTWGLLAVVVIVASVVSGCGRTGDRDVPGASSASTTAAGTSSRSDVDASEPPAPAGRSGGSTEVPSTTGAASPGASVGAPPPTAAPGVEPTGSSVEGQLDTADGRTRTYRLYVPADLPAGSVPLLVALHGGTGWGTQFQLNSRFDRLAEANGFLVVYPDGVGVPPQETGLRTWNGGYCCGSAVRRDVDDVGFVAALIDRIGGEYEVDPARIYAAGHSNGGIMAYRLACELSDRIVAVGVVAGSLGIDDCAPVQSVSLLHVHGTADRNHPIDGGVGADSAAGVAFHPAIDGVRAIAEVDGCPAEPSTTVMGDLVTDTWMSCDGGSEVRFVTIDGAAHPWPGSSAGAGRLDVEPYPDYDASYEIVSFLLAHPRRT
jgi:polyhydroxybutyrate depolymerase